MNLTIPSPSLRCLVSNALLFAEAKGNLAVIRFEIDGYSAFVIATDGYVLSLEKAAAGVAGSTGKWGFSLARADAQALLKMLPPAKDDVPVSITLIGDRAEFATETSGATYSLPPQPFAPWQKWLREAREWAGPVSGLTIAPQLLAKIGRADPYGGQGKPKDWAGVASVTLQATLPPAATIWTYGEYLHGLVKPLTNRTLGGEEVAGPSRSTKDKKPKCPKCGTAELTNGRKQCQSCGVVAKGEK